MPWFVPLAIVVFAIEYYFIVAYEEGVLESIFGRRVPRVQAHDAAMGSLVRPAKRESGPHDWGEALKSEISTFLQYLALVIVFGAKQWFLNKPAP